MDAQKIQIKTKLGTKRPIDDSGQSKIIKNLRQQQHSTHKQPAQDRLKRLQTHLKHVNKKNEKERIQPKRITRSSNFSAPSTSAYAKSQSPIKALAAAAAASGCSTLRNNVVGLRNQQLNEKSKSVPAKASCSTLVAAASSSTSKCYGSPNSRANVGNTWAKPRALFDASNRQESTQSKSANQRLAKIRESLQDQQQAQPHHKEVNNNNKMNKKISDNHLILTSKTATASQLNKTAPANPLAVCNPTCDDMEPMEIDGDEQVEETSCNTPDKHNETNWDEDIEMTLERLIADGNQLPARRVDHMYFVLDTNVLFDNLVFVEDLTRLALAQTSGSMLYIPYIVIKELDKLKDRRSNSELKCKIAVRAIRYLNNKFDNSLQIQAQSAIEESEHLIDIDCADDSIMNCCLQLKEQVPHMMLLTNDANLRLKANATAIKVSCPSDLLRDYQQQFDALPL